RANANAIAIVTTRIAIAGTRTELTLTPNNSKIGAYSHDFSAPEYGITIVGTPNSRLATKPPFAQCPPSAAFTNRTSSYSTPGRSIADSVHQQRNASAAATTSCGPHATSRSTAMRRGWDRGSVEAREVIRDESLSCRRSEFMRPASRRPRRATDYHRPL